MDLPRRLFHPRRLARHIPRNDGGQVVEFVDLAQRSRGTPMLAVLKADVDSLGTTLSQALRSRSDGGPLCDLSRDLDEFFARTLEQAKESTDAPWRNVYTVFSGGDDLLAVGPWDVILDFAGSVRLEFERQFSATAPGRKLHDPLTLSAGIALIKPKYPIHYAAGQAEDLLHRAKSQPAPHAPQSKDQCAALGMVWKWRDHDCILCLARQLADWVDADIIKRGWLHTLLELATLRRGKEGPERQADAMGTSDAPVAALCRGEAGPKHAPIPPAIATSRLAYQVARNWPRADEQNRRKAEARRWINTILNEFDRFESTTLLDALYLSAIVRYALLATRSGTSED